MCANWRKHFPSTYLQAADLDTPIDATIKDVVVELIGTGDQAKEKPVLRFKEKGVKPVVLNQTRSEAVERIAGTADVDEWGGVRVRLQRGTTRFQGKTVDCIDIVAPPASPTKRPPPASPSSRKRSTEPEPDDPMPKVDDDEEPF